MRWRRLLLALGAVSSLAGCASGGSTYDASWLLVHADPTSSSAVVLYFHGDCDSLESAHAIVDATTVTFRIRVHEDAGTCDLAGRSTAIRIRLGTNLGDRRVVGACRVGHGSLCAPHWILKHLDLNTPPPVYGP